MATLSESAALTDDDTYYDLTAEEEALLCEIDIQLAPCAVGASTAEPNESTVFETPRTHVSATISFATSSRNVSATISTPSGSRSREPCLRQSPVPEAVLYPDCMSNPRVQQVNEAGEPDPSD